MSEEEAARRMIELHLLSLAEMLPGLELVVIARNRERPEECMVLGVEEPEPFIELLRQARARRMQ